MKAVAFYEHGEHDVLKPADLPKPQISPNEALVRVRACALNHLDIWVRKGLRAKVPLPHILGSDISGEVEEVGDLVRNFKPGDRVMISPGISCGMCQPCLLGKDNFCPEYKLIGNQVDGGYAEYVRVPHTNLIAIPQGKSFEEAAAFPLVYLTAWHMLVSLAQIRQGDSVLIWAAGSGVGMAGIQVAKLFGAKVIGTVGKAWKLPKAKELGADVVLDHSAEDVVQAVKDATGGRGVDMVMDHIGAATWERSLLSLTSGGVLVNCGATSGYDAKVDVRRVFAKQLSIRGSYMGSKGELLEAVKFYETGNLRPVIDRVLRLEDADKAHKVMEESQHFGKIVLVV